MFIPVQRLEKEPFTLDVYVDGTRVYQLEDVTDFGYDDQDIFLARYEDVILSRHEFREAFLAEEIKRDNEIIEWDLAKASGK